MYKVLSNMIGWRKSLLLRQPVTLLNCGFRFALRKQIRPAENPRLYRFLLRKATVNHR